MGSYIVDFVRFWNSDVLSNRDSVLSTILAKLEEIVS
jgi:very-short-patch-repair endonuclease